MTLAVKIILSMAIIAVGIRLLILGLNKIIFMEYLIGWIVMMAGAVSLGYVVSSDTNDNNEDMRKNYKFSALERMRFDEYGFGLFVIGNDLCFKSADGKVYTVGSGSEISICDDAEIIPLEE